jgi:hypothetical protein
LFILILIYNFVLIIFVSVKCCVRKSLAVSYIGFSDLKLSATYNMTKLSTGVKYHLVLWANVADNDCSNHNEKDVIRGLF